MNKRERPDGYTDIKTLKIAISFEMHFKNILHLVKKLWKFHVYNKRHNYFSENDDFLIP